MIFKKFTHEVFLYSIILILALGLRFYNLGEYPLSDLEAEYALQAYHVSNPGSTEINSDPQPTYTFLTGIFMTLFGATNFTARFWDAIMGGLLVLLPIAFRSMLGRWAAIIMAIGLALDPGLVGLSRQAGGPMLAVSFGLLALGLWIMKRPTLAGIASGFALLSGSAIFSGLFGISMTWIVFRYFRNREFTDPGEEKISNSVLNSDRNDTKSAPFTFLFRRNDNKEVIISACITTLIIVTIFFQYPQGLSNILATLTLYIQGWFTFSWNNPIQLFSALMFYQPLAVIFAAIAFFRWIVVQTNSSKNLSSHVFLLILWSLFSLTLVLIYPSRSVSDLIWAIIPITALAAIEWTNYLPDNQPNLISLLQAGLILILSALFWNTMVATNQYIPPPEVPWLGIRLVLTIGIFALGALTTVLVALGWSWEIGRFGLVWGITGTLAIYTLASLWGVSQLRPNQPQELWSSPPSSGQVDLFNTTLYDLSIWETGFRDQIDIVSTVDSASMRWALRNFKDTRFVSEIPRTEMPSVIITQLDQEEPALTTAYRGQDFVWWVHPGWDSLLPSNFLNWLTFRQAPIINEHVILWARADIFPGVTLDTQEFNLDIK